MPHIEVLTQFVATEVVTTLRRSRHRRVVERSTSISGRLRPRESSEIAYRPVYLPLAPIQHYADSRCPSLPLEIIPIQCSLSPKITPSELSCFGSRMQAEMGELDGPADARDEAVRYPRTYRRCCLNSGCSSPTVTATTSRGSPAASLQATLTAQPARVCCPMCP